MKYNNCSILGQECIMGLESLYYNKKTISIGNNSSNLTTAQAWYLPATRLITLQWPYLCTSITGKYGSTISSLVF